MSASRARWRRVRGMMVLAAIPVLRAVMLPLGWRGGQFLGAALGSLAWPLARRDRRRTLEHLALALPELSAARRRRLGRCCFAHFGTMLIECLRLLGGGCADLQRRVVVEGWEHLEAQRAAGRPLVLLTGHCGNWELLGAAVSCHGAPLFVVGREAQDPRLDALLVAWRARFGTRTITRGSAGAARELLRAMRTGALGVLIDQDTPIEGDWVPFFGHPAYTPTGAAQLALRQRAAVIPTFIERLPGGRHLVRVHPPLELPADALGATAVMTRAIEGQVRRCPEQWVWMHRRWRRQPAPAVVAKAPRS